MTTKESGPFRAASVPDPALAFFAYGLFKPGEISFFQVKDFVVNVELASLPGELLIRDGVVVLDVTRADETTHGVRLAFGADADAAYAAIQRLEPSTQYKWAQVDDMNVLVAVKPRNGTRPLYGEEWSGWRDPAFGPALEVVEEALRQEFDWNDFRPFYRLQAAHMLLWSSVERYVSLRYGLGRDRIVEKVKKLALEPAFVVALRETSEDSVRKLRPVASTGRPKDMKSFNLDSEPVKLVEYLYHVRSNVTHRGKEEPLDWDLVHTATTEVLRTFRAALAEAKVEAGRDWPLPG